MKYTGTAIAKNQKEPQEGAEAPPTLTIDNYVKHGYGVEINKEEGTKYEGQFKNGRHHGIGKLSYEATGDTYEGDWVDGEIEGEGKFNFSNGDVFLGQFKNNQMNSGVLTKANGDEYAGDFVNDLYDGYSLYKYVNGDVYCGDFSQGKKHGDGVLKIKKPDQDFAGRFENDHITHGQVKNDDGEYLGEFAPGTRLY